jgi:hypothetical protein
VSQKSHALIIGNLADEHVIAVSNSIGNLANVTIFDASTLPNGGWLWKDGLVVKHDENWVMPRRGWLRRLAPPGWHYGVGIGTLAAVEAQAALHLLSAASDIGSGIEWLTDYWSTMRGENKLVQYLAAQRIGVPVPPCKVVTSADELWELGESVVMKPLGLGAYTEAGVSFAVYAKLVDRVDVSHSALAAAPFIAQKLVNAVEHLRIPTVIDRAWPCRLDAADLPLDWRMDGDAHTSWTKCTNAESVAAVAIKVAHELNLGYSCQDWVVDESGTSWLVDINPAGQWLFLPDEVGNAVTEAIADWLIN